MYRPFRWFVSISLGAALSLVIDLAAAEVATDNELYAAYCLGVLQDAEQWQRKVNLEQEQSHAELIKLYRADEEFRIQMERSQKDVRRAGQEAAKNLDQKLSRVRTYLEVRVRERR
jgi:hypothetical protein